MYSSESTKSRFNKKRTGDLFSSLIVPVIFILAYLLNSMNAFGTTTDSNKGNNEPSLPPWLRVSGNINFDVNTSKNSDWDLDLRTQDAELRFEVLAREGIRFVVKAELEKLINKALGSQNQNNSDLPNSPQNPVQWDGHHVDQIVSEMLESAFIQIESDKFGLPRAVITFGKHNMAFGQITSMLPMFKDSLLYKLNTESQMIGLTVALPINFFTIGDEVALSLYESGAGDMEISKDKALSVKITKQLLNQVKFQVSALLKEHSNAELESRESMGFVFKSTNGELVIWSEGILMQYDPHYPHSEYGASVGTSFKVGPGMIVIEASLIEKYAREIALAYNMPIGSNLILSPEVRYILYENGIDDTVLGIRGRLQFSSKKTKKVGPR
jgi:hypothetical protein